MGHVFIWAFKQGLGGLRQMWGGKVGDSLLCPCPGPHTSDRPHHKSPFKLGSKHDPHTSTNNKLSKRKQTQTQQPELYYSKIIRDLGLFKSCMRMRSQKSDLCSILPQHSLSRLRPLVDGINGSLVRKRKTVGPSIAQLEMRPLPRSSAPSAQ